MNEVLKKNLEAPISNDPNKMTAEQIKKFFESPEGAKLNDETGLALKNMLDEHTNELATYQEELANYLQISSVINQKITDKEQEIKSLKEQNKQAKIGNKANIVPSDDAELKVITDKEETLKRLKAEYAQFKILTNGGVITLLPWQAKKKVEELTFEEIPLILPEEQGNKLENMLTYYSEDQNLGAIGVIRGKISEYTQSVQILESVLVKYFNFMPQADKEKMNAILQAKQEEELEANGGASVEGLNKLKNLTLERIQALIDNPPAFDSFAKLKTKRFQEQMEEFKNKVQNTPADKIADLMKEQKKKLDELATNRNLTEGEKSRLLALFNGLLNEFEQKKIEFKAVKKMTTKDFLLRNYSQELFSSPESNDAFNKLFDAKGEPNKEKRNDLLREYIKTELNAEEDKALEGNRETRKDKIEYIVTSDENKKDDSELKRYPNGIKVIKIPKIDKDGNEAKTTDGKTAYHYIVFGTNDIFDKLKSQGYETNIMSDNKTQLTIDMENGVSDYVGHFKDMGGAESFEKYLKAFPTVEDLKKNLASILADIHEKGEDNDAFYSKIVDVVQNRSLTDRHLMQTYLNIVNPGDNKRENIVYLGGPAAARANLIKIKSFMENNITKEGDSGQEKMRAQIATMEMMVNPSPEKEMGIFESIKNILKGDYENTNPAIRKFFFMIVEFFGGKKGKLGTRLKEKGLMKNLDDFYAKEFKLSAEKKSAIAGLNESYGKNKTLKVENTTEFQNIFDEKYHDFNGNGFKESFTTYFDEKTVKQLDPTIIQGIITRNKIQGGEKVISTNNKEAKPEVDRNVFSSIKGEIADAIFKDKELLKAVKNAVDRSGFLQTQFTDQDKNPRDIEAGDRAKNGENISLGLSAYLMAGSKEHFYNVLVENDFVNTTEQNRNIYNKAKDTDKGLKDTKDLIANYEKNKTELENKKTELNKIKPDKDGKFTDEDQKKKTDLEKEIKDLENKTSVTPEKLQEQYNEKMFAQYNNIFLGDKATYLAMTQAIRASNQPEYLSVENLNTYLQKLSQTYPDKYEIRDFDASKCKLVVVDGKVAVEETSGTAPNTEVKKYKLGFGLKEIEKNKYEYEAFKAIFLAKVKDKPTAEGILKNNAEVLTKDNVIKFVRERKEKNPGKDKKINMMGMTIPADQIEDRVERVEDRDNFTLIVDEKGNLGVKELQILTKREVMVKDTKIDKKYLDKDGVLRDIGQLSLGDIIVDKEFEGPLLFIIGKENKSYTEDEKKIQKRIGKNDKKERVILTDDGEPTDKKVLIADGDKIRRENSSEELALELSKSEVYNNINKEMAKKLEDNKALFDGTGITVNNTFLSRTPGKIKAESSDKKLITIEYGMNIDQPKRDEKHELSYTRAIESISKDSDNVITIQIKNNEGNSVTRTLEENLENIAKFTPPKVNENEVVEIEPTKNIQAEVITEELAADMPEDTQNTFKKLKEEINTSPENTYIGTDAGPGFIKIGNEIFYNTQGKSDNSRGKINEEGTLYCIFDKAYKVEEKDVVSIGVKQFFQIKTNEGWKLLDVDLKEIKKNEEGYYAIENPLGQEGNNVDEYKFLEDGKLVARSLASNENGGD